MPNPTAKTPTPLRSELLDMVVRDLLGPAGGPDEEISDGSVRERYLVGLLAPKRHEVLAGEIDELAAGGAGTVEDGTTDAGRAAGTSLFPSSLGLTFCVDRSETAVRVTARWGQYSREPSEHEVKDDGNPKLVWKRRPREGVSPAIPLRKGRIERWIPVGDVPDVVVDGIVRDRKDHWSVTLFLVNSQVEPEKLRDAAWLFQPELVVEGPGGDGSAVFRRRPTRRASNASDSTLAHEERAMDIVYRRRLEFAVGHGVSVHAEVSAGDPGRATRLSTRVVPVHEVARVQPPTAEDWPLLRDAVLDMKVLGEAKPEELGTMLSPIVKAYGAWIAEREAALGAPELAEHREAAREALAGCKRALGRIEDGIRLLAEDADAAEAFRFANRAMALQRVRSIYALHKRRGEDDLLEGIDKPGNRSWYPFQLAFLLLNLPGLTRLDHADRSERREAIADLLWFPTGGGKTEAYLGLTAYTLALRRLQGTIEGRSGEQGVAVLMRYTLRLLTLQQFQRAATLMCACEAIRREAWKQGDRRWGETPFRIGLWVGYKTTPNTTEQADEAVKSDHGERRSPMFAPTSGTPAQLTNCPWCGAEIDRGKHIRVDKARKRTLIFCGDPLGKCLFSPRSAPDEGLPVLVVDEEIYRQLPSVLVATVDKFAQMVWNGQVQMLFGQVDGRCSRHGFRSPEVEDKDSHPSQPPLPAARTTPHGPLRPPDLIIQDELHLISGPLGSLVGLYETALDALCTWTVNGRRVRPKVIASTATIRRARDQMHATFLRQVSIFPPHGLDIRDNFFALERPPGVEVPGRLYLGICAPGRRLKAALIRVYLAFLAAGQTLYERHGRAADPWLTLLGYFNSMRELGGMRRLVDDDVKSRLQKMPERGLAKRTLHIIEELTSRKGAADIPQVLDRLEVGFDPDADVRRREEAKKKTGTMIPRPIDVILATNMVSVGVDIQRLGLMVVAGQPKATAEYIQASSRVGRRFPGIVCTVYNWARPRDLSHYETFEHYHATFYRHVEALSVTPFSPGAIHRGLTALLVSLVRLRGSDFNANPWAGRLEREHPYVREAVEVICRRAEQVGYGADVAAHVEAELKERLDEWLLEAKRMHGGAILGYDRARDGVTVPLLRRPGVESWDAFTCLNSLREVEPMVGLILRDGSLDEAPPLAAPVPEVSTAPDDQPREATP